MASLTTLGLSEIKVGTAAPGGTMPATLAKIGATYQDTCKMSQPTSEIIDHYEEGKAVPRVHFKKRKVPVLTFSIMDPDEQFMADYVGGAVDGTTGWGFDGSETVLNRAIQIVTEEGLDISIPNADIEANIDANFSSKGIFLINFTVTPLAVTSGKAIYAKTKGAELVVTPEELTFTNAADSTGQTITATSTGNLTFAGKPDTAEWLTVTRNLKVATVKVSANTNSEARTANVTIIADGITAVIPVTQAGA